MCIDQRYVNALLVEPRSTAKVTKNLLLLNIQRYLQLNRCMVAVDGHLTVGFALRQCGYFLQGGDVRIVQNKLGDASQVVQFELLHHL